SASLAGAAWSWNVFPSAVTSSESTCLTQSCLSITLFRFTCTAAMVLPSWSAVAILAMVPLTTGVGRLAKETTAIITMTTAAAIRTGTMGGSVHFALSNSSPIGMWPGVYCGAGAGLCCPALGCGAGAGGGGV